MNLTPDGPQQAAAQKNANDITGILRGVQEFKAFTHVDHQTEFLHCGSAGLGGHLVAGRAAAAVEGSTSDPKEQVEHENSIAGRIKDFAKFCIFHF